MMDHATSGDETGRRSATLLVDGGAGAASITGSGAGLGDANNTIGRACVAGALSSDTSGSGRAVDHGEDTITLSDHTVITFLDLARR